MLDTNVFRYQQLNIIVTNASTTCFQGPRLILNEPKYKLMNIHNKNEQWLRLRTRLVPLVVERHVAQFGKTITYKFYRQNKYAGRFITENVCAQPGVTLFFCNCNIMWGGGGWWHHLNLQCRLSMHNSPKIECCIIYN